MNNIVSENPCDDQTLFKQTDRFFSQFGLSRILLKCNFYKESGFHCVIVLKELVNLIFRGRNLFRTLALSDNGLPFQKNTAYRFLNSGHFNWSKLLSKVMTQLIQKVDRLTSEDRESVLIVDDSLFSRDRSKKVELLSKVFDHTTSRFFKGFRMLTLGWSDGNSFLPVGFHLLSSQKPENVYYPAAQHDKRTLAFKRRDLAVQCTTDVLLELLRQAKHLPARFVLFDSWFTQPKTVVRVKKEHRDVIGMVRQTEKIHYLYDGKWQDVKKLYAQLAVRADSTNKILGSVCVKLREDKEVGDDDYVDARIVFVKDRRCDNWLALLCTDLAVSEEDVIRIYGKRWDIEVFFKVCKSYLSLAKEFQGRSYDMQVATTTIVFLRYAMLSIETRCAQDERTIGELFYHLREEMADLRFSESLAFLVDTLRRILQGMPLLSETMADSIMQNFLNALPQPYRQRLLISA